MKFDDLLAQRYDRNNNNCLHFAALAWETLTGDKRLAAIREGNLIAARGIMRQFSRVSGPTVDPSVTLMETDTGDEHIGICYRRRLLHLCQRGVEFFPVEAYSGLYLNMRFYQ